MDTGSGSETGPGVPAPPLAEGRSTERALPQEQTAELTHFSWGQGTLSTGYQVAASCHRWEDSIKLGDDSQEQSSVTPCDSVPLSVCPQMFSSENSPQAAPVPQAVSVPTGLPRGLSGLAEPRSHDRATVAREAEGVRSRGFQFGEETLSIVGRA